MSLNAIAPIRAAARDGRLEEVRRITEEGPSDEVAPRGWTAVQWAALRGRTEVVLYLLGAGGREAAWDAEEAVEDEEMLREARTGTAVPRGRPVYGSPLCLASLRGHEETVRALLEAGEGGRVEEGAGRSAGTALYHSVLGGHADVVSVLLAAGADANAATANGGTALMIASVNGHADLTPALVAAGANVNTAEAYGFTALSLASMAGHVGVVQALLVAGASVNATNVNGGTSLLMASQRGHASVVLALLVAGANVNAANVNGWTALGLACGKGHAGVVQALLAAGADLNAAKANAQTALMVVSEYGHAGLARVLLEAGADVNVDALRSDGAGTALILASGQGHAGVAQALLAAGADVDLALPCGSTALSLACDDHHHSAAAVLVRHGAAVTPDIIARCRSLAMAEALVMWGGARVTEALAAAAPTEEVRSFLEGWLAGTHSVQAERREAEDALLGARWGSAGAEYFPAEVVSVVGEYVHARERRVSGHSSSSESNSSSSSSSSQA